MRFLHTPHACACTHTPHSSVSGPWKASVIAEIESTVHEGVIKGATDSLSIQESLGQHQ